MKSISSKNFWQAFTWASILLSFMAIYQTNGRVAELDIILLRSKWILVLGLFIANILAGAFVLRRLSRNEGNPWLARLDFETEVSLRRLFGFILILVGIVLVWVVKLLVFGKILPQIFPIFWVFLWLSLIASFGYKLLTGSGWPLSFAVIIVAQGLFYQIYGHLTVISVFPFSIGYSEAGRHYYASLFFAKSIYGLPLPLPFLHPTRYLLMSLPFLIDGLPLWFHRMWQALLWIGLTAISSILLARRLHLKGSMPFLVTGWAFLYFLQGAVYYHLQICVILILAGVSTRQPGRSLFMLILASIWAGISRVNWFPVPAMLAIAIYILETPVDGKKWGYWKTPFLWGVCGLGTALISQFLYIQFSGNADVRSFGSSFTSDLIWSRLLPNESFQTGVLPGIAIVSLPLILAMVQMARGRFSHVHPLRWLALLSLLLILLVGGMVVSVKIGGGGDLHNMDAFLVLLAVIVTSFLGGRVSGERETEPVWGQVHWNIAVATLLVPIGFALPQIGFPSSYNQVNTEKDVQLLQQAASDVVQSGGEVLFVTERQLLTFGLIRDVPLVPEYEQIELMEMAMSGNREYLEKYYADLKNHRFTIIIAEDQKFTEQKEGAFVEENTAWVRYVGAPLLCAYKPIASLSSTNIVIFVPRPSNPDCKNPF
jgi:hypothetical protein